MTLALDTFCPFGRGFLFGKPLWNVNILRVWRLKSKIRADHSCQPSFLTSASQLSAGRVVWTLISDIQKKPLSHFFSTVTQKHHGADRETWENLGGNENFNSHTVFNQHCHFTLGMLQIKHILRPILLPTCWSLQFSNIDEINVLGFCVSRHP